jgi:hypothetical protein
MVVHACNSRIQGQGDHAFDISLDYTVRFCLKTHQSTNQNKGKKEKNKVKKKEICGSIHLENFCKHHSKPTSMKELYLLLLIFQHWNCAV